MQCCRVNHGVRPIECVFPVMCFKCLLLVFSLYWLSLDSSDWLAHFVPSFRIIFIRPRVERWFLMHQSVELGRRRAWLHQLIHVAVLLVVYLCSILFFWLFLSLGSPGWWSCSTSCRAGSSLTLGWLSGLFLQSMQMQHNDIEISNTTFGWMSLGLCCRFSSI